MSMHMYMRFSMHMHMHLSMYGFICTYNGKGTVMTPLVPHMVAVRGDAWRNEHSSVPMAPPGNLAHTRIRRSFRKCAFSRRSRWAWARLIELFCHSLERGRHVLIMTRVGMNARRHTAYYRSCVVEDPQ